jgi:hypothetical protein
VFEQMRHSRFAIALVSRAHEYGQVHGDTRFGGVGKEQDAETIVEAVFGDAFDCHDLL